MKCAFLFNPNSGKGKILKKLDFILTKLKTRFKEVEVFETSSREDLIEKTEMICQNFDVLVFSGGDGTVNDIVNATQKSGSNIILGYVPSGTVNDFARSVGIPKNTKKALEIICTQTPKFFDGFCVNGRFGAYVCTSGVFTSASYDTKQKTKHVFGKVGYYFHSAKEMFSAKSLEIEAVFDEKQKIEHESVLFLMANSCSVAGWKFNKNSNVHDGKMDFVSVETHKKNKKIGFLALCTIFKMFLFGLNSVKNSKRVKICQFEKAKLVMKNPQIINVDGENAGTGEINIKVCRDLFKMIAK